MMVLAWTGGRQAGSRGARWRTGRVRGTAGPRWEVLGEAWVGRLKIPSEIEAAPQFLKLVLVPRPEILGLPAPPKERLNFDPCNKRQKFVFCVLSIVFKSIFN